MPGRRFRILDEGMIHAPQEVPCAGKNHRRFRSRLVGLGVFLEPERTDRGERLRESEHDHARIAERVRARDGDLPHPRHELGRGQPALRPGFFRERADAVLGGLQGRIPRNSRPLEGCAVELGPELHVGRWTSSGRGGRLGPRM